MPKFSAPKSKLGKLRKKAMEKVFVVGFNYETFVTDDGEPKEYCNVFIVEPFSGDATALYHFGGQKAAKVWLR